MFFLSSHNSYFFGSLSCLFQKNCSIFCISPLPYPLPAKIISSPSLDYFLPTPSLEQKSGPPSLKIWRRPRIEGGVRDEGRTSGGGVLANLDLRVEWLVDLDLKLVVLKVAARRAARRAAWQETRRLTNPSVQYLELFFTFFCSKWLADLQTNLAAGS